MPVASMIIRQRAKAYTTMVFNLAAQQQLNKIIQGYISERVWLRMDPATSAGLLVLATSFFLLDGGVDCLLGTDADYLCLECVDGDVWVEVARG